MTIKRTAENPHALRGRVFLSGYALLLILLSAMPLLAEETEIPAVVNSAGGSRLLGLIQLDPQQPLVIRTENGREKINPAEIKKITFGERADPNLENEALVALGHLQSDEFKTREEAEKKIRALGRAAIRALRTGTTMQDVELANRAKAMLAELDAQNAADTEGDRVILSNGKILRGEVSPGEVTFRSRFGVLKFPLQALESIELVKATDVSVEKLAPLEPPIAVKIPSPPVAGVVLAERWDLRDAAEDGAAPFTNFRDAASRSLSGMRMLTMDKAPDPEARDAQKKPVDLKPGARIEDAYSKWGALLRPLGGVAIKTVEVDLSGVSRGLAGQIEKQDCEVIFAIPGSYEAKTGEHRSGGVTMVGAIVQSDGPMSIGLAVYDRAGRQLAEVFNFGYPRAAGGPAVGDFIGVRSKVPIVRARFFRAGANKGQDLVIDDILFDRIVTVERPAHFSCIWLASGERLSGDLSAAAMDSFKFSPEFLAKDAKPVSIGIAEIDRFEPQRSAPPVPAKRGESTAPPPADAEKKTRRAGLGAPHGVLLQSGETFRAMLLKIDEKDALFMLPGGVELKLPRTLMRKIDLAPPIPEPGDLPAPITVADDEKPGVDFRRKEAPKPDPAAGEMKDPEKEQAEKEKAEKDKKKGSDLLHTTQELARMDNVEIVSLDLLAREITTRDDGGGDFTIGLAPVRTLVFPKDPNAKRAAPKFRDWILTLREGSRFEITLTAITSESITVEMASGTVTLPMHVIDSIHRQKR